MQAVPKIRAAVEQIRDQGGCASTTATLRTKDGRELQVEMIANVYSEGTAGRFSSTCVMSGAKEIRTRTAGNPEAGEPGPAGWRHRARLQ